MKFLTWILVLCFTSQAMASTIRQGLEAAMNDYEYEMVVEWDQKDAKKAEAFTQKFTEKLDALYQQGMSNDELMKYVESRVHDKKQLEAVRASAALHANGKTTAKDIAQMLQDNKLGNQGASWTGGVASAAIITGLVVIAALIVYQLVWSLKNRCTEAKKVEECGNVDYCEEYSYDEYGDEYCSYWSSSWECHDVEYCLGYEEYK